ncbi:hypothetical protein TRFO_42279 [Tritrichomonas foetus]|uniref:Uncharacterized protein n=1 Tax=Tritrichomonas foetus TaxID=1144522 RepID=A0A1J4L1I8_9EUKA|nr:hypothetical protein TRFO_42279 [Tritrichomonas foetus]|eukprot:OHT15822.1 hypothetical protein TRFO_42279 [Tritrichomonas foetus]
MPPRKLGIQKRTPSESSIKVIKKTQLKPAIQIKQRETTSGKPSERKFSPQEATQNLPSLGSARPVVSKPIQPNKTVSNDERITNLLNRILAFDKNEHEKRAMLLKSVKLFMSQKNPALTTPAINLFIQVFKSVFSTAPPFSIITKSYRHIYFNPRDHPEDVSISYQLFEIVNNLQPNYPKELLKGLVRRLASASNDDRNGAKNCLKIIDDQYHAFILHSICLSLVPPPPHGIDTSLELITDLLKVFDNPAIENTFYSPSDALCNNAESEICEEIQKTFRLLHFAPHFQTFFQTLLSATKALIERDEILAHESRLFLVNFWPRLDPQKAVLFLQEATSLCREGPPVEESVWQRLSWRASSIQWQIAMEGLNFILETIENAKNYNNDVLVFLLNETVKNHWNVNVKNKAAEVLKLVEGNPSPPKTFPIDVWNALKKQAETNYPNTDFSGRKKKPLRRCK